MEYCVVMWRIIATEGWLHDQRQYSIAKPDAVAVVIRNLQRYHRLLNVSIDSKSVEAEYLHHESAGIVSISQHGLGNFEEDFRIYTYAEDATRYLFLLAMGKENEKNADLEYCMALVYHRKEKTKT